jgi:hypothetical protein
MSKVEIFQELPNLKSEERRELLDRICELEEEELLRGGQPTTDEKALLDSELEEYERNPQAGSTWKEFEARRYKQSSQ